MTQETKKVLSYTQDHKFYYQRAKKLIDEFEYHRGIKLLYNAIDLQPDSIKYRMTLSEVLCEIGYYNKSIDEIFNIIVIGKKIPTDCFYFLGYNFYETGEYIKALNMFERYMMEEPNGKYNEDVYYLLESIEHLAIESWNEERVFPKQTHSFKSNVINIDSTKITDDVEIWAKEQNIKALMAYAEGEYDESIEICKNVQKKLSIDYNIMCTLSLAHYKKGDIKKAEKIAFEVVEAAENDSVLLYKISYVLCSLKLDEEVVEVYQKLLQQSPYNQKLNHYLAIGLYNTGDYEGARKLWFICNEIARNNLVFKWYLHNAEKGYKSSYPRLEYIEQLPSRAVANNLILIEKLIKDANGEINETHWAKEEFKDIALWGLERNSEEIQKRFLQIVYRCAGDEREKIFRKLLLSHHLGESVKNEVLAYLSKLGTEEPYIMMADYQLVDVMVNVVTIDSESKKEYIEVLDFALKLCDDDKILNKKVNDLWTRMIIGCIKDKRKIKNTILWAVALFCVARLEKGDQVDVKEVAKKHELSKSSLYNVMKIISGKMEETNE